MAAASSPVAPDCLRLAVCGLHLRLVRRLALLTHLHEPIEAAHRLYSQRIPLKYS